MHSCHVENVARIDQTIEVEDPEAEYQEEQLPGEEHEIADQVEQQFPEANFANTDPQQGKHWIILNPESLTHVYIGPCALLSAIESIEVECF